MSAVTDRLTDDDYRELARIIRQTHARTAARHERERLAAGTAPCQCPACEYTRRSGAHAAETGDRDAG